MSSFLQTACKGPQGPNELVADSLQQENETPRVKTINCTGQTDCLIGELTKDVARAKRNGHSVAILCVSGNLHAIAVDVHNRTRKLPLVLPVGGACLAVAFGRRNNKMP